jgi:hypothetical protein
MTSKYTTSQTHIDSNFTCTTTEFSSKSAALKAAVSMPGLVRVATPAGNLVKYVDNRQTGFTTKGLPRP